jgi:acetyl-CoA carboxylase carboxyl transferase subunit alpha
MPFVASRPAGPDVMRSYLDFEKPIAELEAKIEELRAVQGDGATVTVSDEIERLEARAAKDLKDLYAGLTPWQKTLVARHPQRPHFTDYVEALIEDFTPLAGDRSFGDDAAILGGPARFRGRPVLVLGHEKGSTTETRLKHNFGMARPEGYRKAVRLMELADRFDLPVISLVDTAGAYPGIGAEERGQAEAIARSTEAALNAGVPNVSVIIGEGGSGGAIAIAATSRVMMLEHSIYSVISPEGAASILWRDTAKAQDAATGMRITAQDLLKFGVIDTIVPEPAGGAHRDPSATIAAVGDAIEKAIAGMDGLTRETIRKQRRDKFLAIGRGL